MMQFRKRPTLVDAVQWDGTADAAADIKSLCKIEVTPESTLYIFTSSGLRMAGRGCWIVRDGDGHINIYYPAQFALQYDPI